jgi:hypothetical protein
MKQFPKARKEKLVVQPFNEELLVYDRQRHKAHCLNHTAAVIWKNCDGKNSIAELSQIAGQELATPAVDERLVWYALKQLKRDHLLEDEVVIPAGILASVDGRLDRRAIIRVLSLTALVVLPLVTSINTPAAGDATSCIPAGGGCQTSIQCCNGLCNSNTCN